MRHPLLTAATVLCAAVLIFSVIMLVRYWLEYAEGDALYEELGGAKVVEPVESETDPFPAAIAGMKIDFSSLRAVNPGVVGWLYGPGTVIDYPIVQGEDNSFYLTHLYDGKRNGNGSLFMDYRNNADFSDVNTLIYGHHMKTGKMFGSLEGYKKQEYYDAHPVLYLFTPAEIYEIQVFAGIVQSGKMSALPVSFPDEESYNDLIADLKGNSTFSSDVKTPALAPLITLVTCTYDYKDAR
jgi:sortase B